MPVLVLLLVAGVECNSEWSETIYLTFKTQQTPTKYLHGRKYAVYNKQFYATFPWRDFFPNNSLIFSKIPDISLTAVKFPDISRFSRQVVMFTLSYMVLRACQVWLKFVL